LAKPWVFVVSMSNPHVAIMASLTATEGRPIYIMLAVVFNQIRFAVAA
jgi:hypothetical protein